MEPVALSRIVNFIITHPRRNRVCVNWTIANIADKLNESLAAGGLCVITTPQGVIEGICAAIPNHNCKTLHVSIILTHDNSTNVARQMLNVFYQHFNGYTIEAYRRGKKIRYTNTTRLMSLLTKVTK